MLLIMVVSIFAAVGLVGNLRASRRDRDPLLRQQRALSALQEIAEHPHPLTWDVAPAEPISTEHVHILETEPVAASAPARPRRRKNRTTARRTPVRRPNALQVASRPTIALLPAQAHLVRTDVGSAEAEAATESERDTHREPDTPSATLRDEARPGASPVLPVVVATIVVVIAALGAMTVSMHRGHAGRARPAALATASRPLPARPQPTTPRTLAQVPDAVRLVSTTQGEGTVTVTPPFILTVTSTGDCWVRIQTETGQTMFEGTMHAGQFQRITGATALVLRLGNTPAVNLTVNGTHLDLSGVARTTNVRFLTS